MIKAIIILIVIGVMFSVTMYLFYSFMINEHKLMKERNEKFNQLTGAILTLATCLCKDCEKCKECIKR